MASFLLVFRGPWRQERDDRVSYPPLTDQFPSLCRVGKRFPPVMLDDHDGLLMVDGLRLDSSQGCLNPPLPIRGVDENEVEESALPMKNADDLLSIARQD